jgi:leucyl aminopeptidase
MNTMLECFTEDAAGAVPVQLLTPATLQAWRAGAATTQAAWVSASGFDARPGSLCLLPDAHGALTRVLVGGEASADPFVLGDLPQRLPGGDYRLQLDRAEAGRDSALLGFALGAYRFTRYRKCEERGVRMLLATDDPCAARVNAIARAVYLARDLINTPAQDMLPGDLAAAAETLAGEFGAGCEIIVGDELLARGFPAIHAVGRASTSAPRLVRLDWGRADAPRIALVGKGVCFDSGGLDIKPASGMRLMKKDMGGAAQALALARLIMDTGLDVRLQVLVPAVENAIAGNAMRPGDVVMSRQGISIEIDNTDAEGRVILSDALTLAGEGKPELIVDFATLTGAARVAVGTELSAMFCNDDALARGIETGAAQVHDPVWRMPLYRPYAKLIESKVADIANSGGTPHAGAITAALFLERFVPEHVAWAHFDIMAWNPRERPGRPEGGEAMALRAVFAYLQSRYGVGNDG